MGYVVETHSGQSVNCIVGVPDREKGVCCKYQRLLGHLVLFLRKELVSCYNELKRDPREFLPLLVVILVGFMHLPASEGFEFISFEAGYPIFHVLF